MRSGHYTRLKGRTTYFRRKIPDSIRTRLASSEICVKLGVINRDSAERIGRRLAVAVDVFFCAAERNPMLDNMVLSRVITQTIADWKAENERCEAEASIRHGGIGGPSARDNATMYAELAEAILEAHNNGQSTHDAEFVESRFQAVEANPPSDPTEVHLVGRRVSLGLALHYLETAIDIAGRHGLDSGWRALPLQQWDRQLARLKAKLVDQQPHIPAVSEPARPSALVHEVAPRVVELPPQPTSSPDSPLFSELFDTSLDSRIELGLLREGQRHGTQSSKRIWTETCGDRPLGEYGRQDFARFRATLLKLPKHYWKSKAEQEKPILQVIAEAEAQAMAGGSDGQYQRVGAVTVNKHLSYIGPFFEWAKTEGHISQDTLPFWTGFHLPTGEEVTGLAENEERPAFSEDQIKLIFEHPVWTGRRSARFYNAPGKVIIRDSLYWGPLIATYSLMRREEFSQLKVKHVRQEAGIWVFDLYHHELSLKRSSSKRYVPLHRCLLELGFIQSMVEGREPEERLFPELYRSKSHGRFGDSLGNQFARVIDHQGIVVIRKDGQESDGAFHPLRHYGETCLLNAHVPDGIVDALAGHKSSSRVRENREHDREKPERTRYNKGYFVETLKEAIDKLEAPVAIAKLVMLAEEFEQVE